MKSSSLLKLVTGVAGYYKRLPFRPFSSLLEKLYFSFLSFKSDGSLVQKCIDGVNFELDLKEVIDSAMFYEGSRELGTSLALKKLCKPGHVVFDIGANVGSHALPMASYVGKQGKVYAFEPVPWAIKKLKRSLELNNFDNLVIESIALSDITEQEVEMDFRASFKVDSKSGVGQDGKVDNGWWSECEHVKVRMETLDNYASNHQISRLDLIKLDVDGFEGKVFRGAFKTLKRFQPILIMEVAPAWAEMRGDNILDILHHIEQLNYKFYAEKDFKEIHNLTQLIGNLSPGGGINVVASVHSLNSAVAS